MIKDRYQTLLIHFTNITAIISLCMYLYRSSERISTTVIQYVVIPISLFYVAFYYFNFKKNIPLRNFCSIFPSTIIMLVLVIAFGGIHAPGAFWVAGLPIFYSIFFRSKGVYYGLVAMIIILIGLFIFEGEILRVTLPVSNEIYVFEKKSNIIHFSVVLTLFFLYYSWLNENSKSKLEQINEQLDTLLHVVLHDLSNPITILKLKFANMNRRLELAPSELSKISSSFLKIEEIIHNVRSFKLNSESIEEQRQLLSFADIKLFSQEYLEQHNTKNLRLEYDQQSDEPFKFVYSILTDHILSNLLSNAIKFSHDNSIIKIAYEKMGDYIKVTISDEGIGIPANLIEDIFDFNKKTSRLGTAGEVGTGYGLPIVRYFVDLYGGQIQVLSPTQTGVGTSFTLSFKSITKI